MPQRSTHGRKHHTEDGNAGLDQGDVDGEFAIALDEFARAVQRIHQPVALPVAPCFPRDIRRFFRQYRQVRGQAFQSLDDAVMRGQVCGGQRAGIGLAVDFKRVFVDIEDGSGGLARDADHRFAQLRAGQAHAGFLSHSRAMNRAASERPSEKSSRSISWSRSASFHGTTSSSSGSSPGRRSGYRSRASTSHD